MRITHRRKKEDPRKIYRFNLGIISPEVFVLGNDGKSLGAMNTAEARRLAAEQGFDLVEINPKAEPPVARIMNFGQFQYQQEKEARIRKAHQHVTKIKNVRLSLRIGAHDLEIRRKQTKEFLEEGDKAKIDIMLRGRENQQWQLAMDIVKKFVAAISAEMTVVVDQPLERAGNVVTITIGKG